MKTRREEFYAKEFQRTGDPKYRDMAVGEMRDLIFSAVRAMNLSRSIDTRTLYMNGLGLATKAIETWDPSKSKLSTYVTNALNPLNRVVYKHGPTLHTPEHQIKDFGKFKKHYAEYVNEYGEKDIDPLILADMSGLSIKKVKEFITRERGTYNDSTLGTYNIMYQRSDHRMDLEYLNDEFKDDPLQKKVWKEIAKGLSSKDEITPNARDVHRKVGGSYYEVNKAYKEIVEKINRYLTTIS
jgi:DNA-directed RNA polymerase sigma subunit (sigma70/sigma32)